MPMIAQDLALLADADFVSADEFEKVAFGQIVAMGFLKAYVETLEEFGEGESAGMVLVCWWMKSL